MACVKYWKVCFSWKQHYSHSCYSLISWFLVPTLSSPLWQSICLLIWRLADRKLPCITNPSNQFCDASDAVHFQMMEDFVCNDCRHDALSEEWDSKIWFVRVGTSDWSERKWIIISFCFLMHEWWRSCVLMNPMRYWMPCSPDRNENHWFNFDFEKSQRMADQ